MQQGATFAKLGQCAIQATSKETESEIAEMQKDPFADWQIHPVSKLVLVDPCCRCCSHRNHQDLTDCADKAKAVI